MNRILGMAGKARAAAAMKIRTQFPKDEFSDLMFAVIETAIGEIGVFADAERYLRTDPIPHAEICGVNSEWVRRVLKELGLIKSAEPLAQFPISPHEYDAVAKELEEDTKLEPWPEKSEERETQLRVARRCRQKSKSAEAA